MNQIRTRVNTIVVCFVLVFSLLFVTPLFVKHARAAGPYYVATTGDDAAVGDFAHPFKTFWRASNATAAGDTVYFMAGTYSNMQLWYLGDAGTAGNWITYETYGDGPVYFDGTGKSWGASWQSIIYYGGITRYVRISNITFRNAPNYALTFESYNVGTAHNITVDNCTFYNCTKSAINFQGGGARLIKDLLIENCTMYDCQNAYAGARSQETVTFCGCKDFIFRNNHMYGNYYDFVDTKGSTSWGQLYRNKMNTSLQQKAFYIDCGTTYCNNLTYYDNEIWGYGGGLSIAAEGGGNASNISIYNNVFNMTGYYAIEIAADSSSNWGKKDINIINNDILNINVTYKTVFRLYSSNNSCHNLTIRNNIIEGGYAYAFGAYGLNLFYQHVDYNLYNLSDIANNTYWGSGSVNGSPCFVDPDNSNYRLLPNSPAIDNGSSIYAPGVDYDDISRPQGSDYDIGAYEYIFSFTDIVIPSDGDFDYAHGVRYGSGTTSSPYMICNWTIQNLTVYDTTLNFTIQNCTITYHINITDVANSSLIEINNVSLDGSDSGKHSMCWIMVTKSGIITLHNSSFVNLSHSIIGW